jgi:hypothetical protein
LIQISLRYLSSPLTTLGGYAGKAKNGEGTERSATLPAKYLDISTEVVQNILFAATEWRLQGLA